MPLVIDAAEWAPLEVGLAQRAELLNAILVDLYGEQRLLADGIVPAGRGASATRGFTRVVARPAAIDPRPLVLAATDLGRDADGAWRVLADRAQAPSGIGYAMENRRVISRVLPELYREAGLHRMEPYFWALRSALIQSAQGDLADPRVVVLSPGTPLRDGVRPGVRRLRARLPARRRAATWWSATAGSGPARRSGRLERVDVILRRVDAAWSDPLELRGDSQLGVAGLVEAVRRGRVRVVNGLGAGVLENPGAAALPAGRLRGAARRAAAARRRCRPGGAATPTGSTTCSTASTRSSSRAIDGRPGDLADLATDELRARVLAAPHRYVGQERLPLSQAPTWAPAAAPRAGAGHAAHVHAALRVGVPPAGRRARQRARRDGRDADQQGRVGAQGRRRRRPTRAWPTCCR